jgi:plastocyanin
MVPGQSGPSYCPVVGRGYWSSYVMAPLGAWKRPGRGRFLRNIPTAVSRAISRSRPPMRSIRLLAAGLTILAVAACATSTPGWTYAPAPSATPIPSAGASASAGPSGSAAPSVVELAAQNIAFTPTELSVAADVAFQINFANNDAGVPHNVEIKDAGGVSIFKGDIFNGVETRTYAVEPLTAGTYQFVCSVHSNMTGTLTAQ